MILHGVWYGLHSVEVNPDMPRKKSKAVPEDNGPVSLDTSGICGITMEQIRRILSGALEKYFDELEKSLDRISDITNMLLRATD